MGLTRLVYIIACLLLATLVCITFLGIAISSTNRFRSCLACAIGRLFCVSSIWVSLSWYIIFLSRSYPSEMRFDSHSSTRATRWGLIDASSARAIYTIPMPSDRMISLSGFVKFHVLGYILPIKRLWLLVRWRDTHESRYQVDCVCDIIGDSVVMKAFPE